MNLIQYVNQFDPTERREVVEKLAKKLGLSVSTIQSIRSGYRRVTPETAIKLEKVTKGIVTKKDSLPKIFN